jgi:hypothetical protein
VPRLIARFGCAVTVVVNPALVELVQGGLQGGLQGGGLAGVPVLPYTADVPEATGWCLLLSLPALLREKRPADVPPPILPFGMRWAPVPRETQQPTQQPTQHGLRVFVHGRGNAQHGYDFDRSAPGRVLEDAVTHAGHEVVTAEFINMAATTEQHQVLAEPSWRDTVERLLTCDRCLTVDTGLAHVAGSLGIPTDLCVPTIPEWRWGNPDQRQTPWYPSARLWRRTRTEQWAEMLAQMTQTWTSTVEEHA